MRRPKTHLVKARLTGPEKEAAQSQAQAVGMSISSLIRVLLSGVKVRAAADVAVLAELRRQGGLVKQAFASGADPRATSAALVALQQAAERLAPKQ